VFRLASVGLTDALKLGIGGLGALMGRQQQQAAIKQAAAAAQQYKDAAAAAAQQYKDLAQPLLGPGYSALSQAQQGALSAANRQAFDVARARAAQAFCSFWWCWCGANGYGRRPDVSAISINSVATGYAVNCTWQQLGICWMHSTLAGQQGALPEVADQSLEQRGQIRLLQACIQL
jgi:hypothetical protein